MENNYPRADGFRSKFLEAVNVDVVLCVFTISALMISIMVKLENAFIAAIALLLVMLSAFTYAILVKQFEVHPVAMAKPYGGRDFRCESQ